MSWNLWTYQYCNTKYCNYLWILIMTMSVTKTQFYLRKWETMILRGSKLLPKLWISNYPMLLSTLILKIIIVLFFISDNFNVKFIAPILKKEKYSLLGLKESLSLTALTILTVVIIWMILWILKFNRHFWQFLHILQLVLGFTVPLDVNRLSNRVALTSILLGFWLLSSSLYSILTNVRITSVSEDIVINSLYELRDSGENFTAADCFYINRNGNEISLTLGKYSHKYGPEVTI